MQQDVSRLFTRGRVPAGIKMLLIVACVILLTLALFRVRSIEVEGTAHYTNAEIEEAMGVSQGESLIGLKKTRLAARILAKLPYVESVRITKILPGTLHLDLVETEALYASESEYQTTWVLNENEKLLESAEEIQGMPVVQGNLLLMPISGETAQFEDNTKAEKAKEIVLMLKRAGLYSNVKYIRFDENGSISILYNDRVWLELGTGEQLEYQLGYFLGIRDQLEDDESGYLDLTFSSESTAVFHPSVQI